MSLKVLGGNEFRLRELSAACGGSELHGAYRAAPSAMGPRRAKEDAQFSSSSFKTAIKASVGIWTEPRERIFFLPSFCFSSSFFFRVMSPP